MSVRTEIRQARRAVDRLAGGRASWLHVWSEGFDPATLSDEDRATLAGMWESGRIPDVLAGRCEELEALPAAATGSGDIETSDNQELRDIGK